MQSAVRTALESPYDWPAGSKDALVAKFGVDTCGEVRASEVTQLRQLYFELLVDTKTLRKQVDDLQVEVARLRGAAKNDKNKI
jgi:hypothetical protein